MSEPGYHEIEPIGGHPRWACDVEGCPCDSFTERLMIEHVKLHRQSETLVLTDKDGRVKGE